MAIANGTLTVKGSEMAPSQSRGPLVETVVAKSDYSSATLINFGITAQHGKAFLRVKKKTGELVFENSYSSQAQVVIKRDDAANTDNSIGNASEWSLVDGDYIVEMDCFGAPFLYLGGDGLSNSIRLQYSGHGTVSNSVEFTVAP